MFYANTFLWHKNNIRKTWGIIIDTLQSNCRSKCQSKFIFDNRIIRDTDEIADHVNDNFINISRTLSHKSHRARSLDLYLNDNATSKFPFHDYIGKLIDDFKNKARYGHDNISNNLIKCTKEVHN